MRQFDHTQLNPVMLLISVLTLSAVCFVLSVTSASAVTGSVTHASHVVLQKKLNHTDIQNGITIETPKEIFRLGVPPETLRASTATVDISAAPRSSVTHGKRKLKTKNIFSYSITSKAKGPLWIQVRNGSLKKSDTLKYYNEKTGKWKKIPSTVKKREGVIQGTLKKRSATIGVFQKKKRKKVVKVKKNHGEASWYTPGGKQLTAAHRTLPFGTVVRVKNLSNGESVDVTIADRGPFVKGRIIDLSKFAFAQIEDPWAGVARVQVTIISRP